MIVLGQNGLALYGAVTGTAALIISFFSHRHNVQKDQIKLAVSFTAHPKQAENIERLNTADAKSPWNRPHIVEVYLVTVRNLGSIPAPLDDVGVYDRAGKKHQALVGHRSHHVNILRPLSESEVEPLEPRCAKTFSIYLAREKPMFSALSAYAIDQTGKTWRVRK